MKGPCVKCGRVRNLKREQCGACYERAWRASHPEEQKARRQRAYVKKSIQLERVPRGGSAEVRLLRRVICDLVTHCWLWQGYKDARGYGKASGEYVSGTIEKISAHRLSYMLFVGPIPEGMQIDHLCRVRHCVNPEHLEVVTPYENYLRGTRGATGPRPRHAKAHCKYGHPYNEENTYWYKDQRFCKTCHNERRRTGTIVHVLVSAAS
jgi:HNH endonuclease